MIHAVNRKRPIFLGLMAVAVAVFSGCGYTVPKSDLIVLTISPARAVVLAGETVQFTASSNEMGVVNAIWLVNGVAGGAPSTGTITSGGLYTAPDMIVAADFQVTVEILTGFQSAPVIISVVVPGTVSATNNPLVALYSLSAPQNATVQIQFGTDTQYGQMTWIETAPSGGGEIDQYVAGMQANSTYHMRAIETFSDGTQFLDADHVFTTGSLPSIRAPSISTTSTPGQTPNPGIEILDFIEIGSSDVSAPVVATDLDGNIIWYYYLANPNVFPDPPKLLSNGHFLINFSGSPDGTNSVLQEIDLAGNVHWQMTAADLNSALADAGFNLNIVGTHHDFAVLPNGHLVLIASEQRDFTDLPGFPGSTTVTGDDLIDLDANKKPVWVWSSFDHLDVNRHPLNFPDWTHMNAVLHSPDDGNLIVSIRDQNWVIKIDYSDGVGTGNIIWKLGEQGDFTLQNGTDPQDWFYAQHAPILTSTNSSGNFQLLLFDNGNQRELDSNGDVCGSQTPCNSAVPTLQLDETARTAAIAWRDVLPVFSNFGGYAQVLANGNIEFDECATTTPANNAAVYEVTHETSPQIIWQMQIAGAYAYRAFRIPSLYPGVQW